MKMRVTVLCVVAWMALTVMGKGKVQWKDEAAALHLGGGDFGEYVVASCATMPEAQKYWAYCGWRKASSDTVYASVPKGYFECKTNDANGNLKIEAIAEFEEDYEGVTVELVKKSNLSEAAINVEQCQDAAIKALLSDGATRKLVRLLYFDEIIGNGSIGNYTREAKASFTVTFSTRLLLPGYERVETSTGKKDITIALEGVLHTWLVWHVLNGKPAAAGAQHVKKRYCRRNGAQYDLYECRQTGGLQAAAGVAEGGAAAMGAMEPVQNISVALSPGTASSSDVTGGKPIVGPTGSLVPAPPPVEPADEPGYGWVMIGTLPSDVYYTSTAP